MKTILKDNGYDVSYFSRHLQDLSNMSLLIKNETDESTAKIIIENYGAVGNVITGSFEGTLYNRYRASDSIIVSGGTFSINRIADSSPITDVYKYCD